MQHSKSRGKERGTSQTSDAEPHQHSQLPIIADLADLPVLVGQAGAMADQDAVDEKSPYGTGTDNIQIAQAAIDYRIGRYHLADMESIKALLRNYLDAMREPQTENSSYFVGLLSQWLDIWRKDRNYALLIYVLGNGTEQHERRSIDPTDLETIGQIETNLLLQQSIRRGACLHLAKMTSAVNTDPQDPSELKMAISLHDIRTLSGGLLIDKPVAVGKDSLLQKSLLTDRYYQAINRRNPYPSPSDRSPIRQTDSAKSFQDRVLVFMPEEFQFEFLVKNADPQELHQWVKMHSTDVPESDEASMGTDANARWGLALACKTQLNNLADWFIGRLDIEDRQAQDRRFNMLEAVVCASLQLRDRDLFGKAINLFPRMLPLRIWEGLGCAMDLAAFSFYTRPLTQALDVFDSFQDRYVILQSFREGCETQMQPPELMETVNDWIRDQVERALSDVQRVEENDGAVLIDVAKRFAQVINIHRIITFAKKHCDNYRFTIECAFSLYDELAEGSMHPGQAKCLLAEILSAALPVLCSRGPDNWSLHPWSPSRVPHTSAQHQQELHADRMARLIRCCVTVGLYDVEHALLRHFWLDASTADARTLQHIFLPYLAQLLSAMHDYRIPYTTPIYQWQFQQVISRFITLYIGKEPTPPSSPNLDPIYPPLGCASISNPYGCPVCVQLDAFLVNPHEKTVEISGGIDAPEHIKAQIRDKEYLRLTILTPDPEPLSSSRIRISKIELIKKDEEEEERDPRHELWRERVVKANGMIQAICGDEGWKLLLGERYGECMGLEVVRGR